VQQSEWANRLFLHHGPKVLRRVGEGLLDTLANPSQKEGKNSL
jgi:hypothetical protein